jgi:hypothetical protein
MPNQGDYRTLVLEILGRSREAAEQVNGVGAYQQGLRMAYYDILSFAIDQAEVFGLAPGDLDLAGFVPETILKDRAA